MTANPNWHENNRSYWSTVARRYNDSYTDPWSALENDFVRSKLSFLKSVKSPKVLDLGCGTGLGFSLCTSINSETVYTGIDISTEMLDHTKSRHPEANVSNLSMSDLSSFQDNSYNTVISIFTAFSYTDDVEKTISEVARILPSGGHVLISVLSKYSLRRILNLKFGQKEKYKTRGIASKQYSYAWMFTRRQLKILFADKFEEIEIVGYNAFAGVRILSQYPKLWGLNKKISMKFSNLSHELILTAKKK